MSISNIFSHSQSPIVYRILRHRRLFLSVFIATFALITACVIFLPRKYESRMKLLVNTERQDLVITPNIDKTMTSYQELAETRINSEIELLKSWDVLSQVVRKAGLLKTQTPPADDQKQSAELAMNRAVESLEHHLDIEPVKKSDIISVSYRAKAPQTATAVLKVLSEAYLEQHMKAHATPGTFVFFDEQAKVYAERLARSEEQLRVFRQRHAALLDPNEKDPIAKRAIEAQASLDDAEAGESEYKKRVDEGFKSMAAMDQRVTSQVRVSPQTALIAQLSGMLAELENRRTEMATKFRPDDRFVTELDKEITETKAALNSAVQNSQIEKTTDVNQVRQETEKNQVSAEIALAGLEARRAKLAYLMKGYKKQMADLASAASENDRLERAVREDEENYLLYSKRREEARIAESLDQKRITDVSVIESPTLELDPVSPSVPIDLVVGFLFSMMVAYLSVRLREHFSRSWTDEETLSPASVLAA